MTQVEAPKIIEADEEESFVILGSSASSFNSYPSRHSLVEKSLQGERDLSGGKNNESSEKILTSSSTSTENFSLFNSSIKIESAHEVNSIESKHSQNISKSMTKSVKKDASLEKDVPSTVSQYNSISDKQNSLAASFLLGEVQMDELKATVFCQFPSLCNPQAKVEDIVKLQNLVTEYSELKDIIKESNRSIPAKLISIQKWQEEIQTYIEKQQKQMKEWQTLVAKLRNENLELKNEVHTKMEQISISERTMKEENQELVKLVSEKTSLVENMRAQLKKIEENQLLSFEYIKKNENDDFEHEYISIIEHKKALKDLERKLSTVVAENLQIQDMKQTYIDELNCLKVNLTAAEELLKKAKYDISILKSKDVEKSLLYEKYEKEKDEMRQEIDLLRTQLEVYRKDFEMERIARQNLAGEKDQLLTDLKMLQRRNQQLIEQAQVKLEESSNRFQPNTSSGGIKTPKKGNERKDANDEQIYTRATFVCPLCSQRYNSFSSLQNHVQDCLEKS